jgi:hypothetical protein
MIALLLLLAASPVEPPSSRSTEEVVSRGGELPGPPAHTVARETVRGRSHEQTAGVSW